MPEALESISSRSVGTLTPLSPAADTGGVDREGRARERSAFSLSGRADDNADGGAGARNGTAAPADSLTLSPEARSQLRELQQRDAEVRAHEQAHMAAGGPHVTGGASYTYQKGPDGRQYAIGGQVSIDASAVPGDPEATREKARQVRRAALAPGEPSGQDQQVAAKAAGLEADAAAEEQNRKLEEARGSGESFQAEGLRDATGPEGVSVPGAPVGGTSESPGSARAAYGGSGENGADFSSGGDPRARTAQRAANAYAEMSMRGSLPTALAPNGTGISLEI